MNDSYAKQDRSISHFQYPSNLIIIIIIIIIIIQIINRIMYYIKSHILSLIFTQQSLYLPHIPPWLSSSWLLLSVLNFFPYVSYRWYLLLYDDDEDDAYDDDYVLFSIDYSISFEWH